MLDGKLVPFTREIALQISLNAHLLSLGDPKRATEMLAEAGINDPLALLESFPRSAR